MAPFAPEYTKYLVSSGLHGLEFDNLVIDEGSMMSIPHLILLGKMIKKRIVVCGDFKQLGPIVLSCSYNAQKWLHPDLFTLLGKTDQEKITHNAMKMLDCQRRSAKKIADLINVPFYSGKLNTANQISHILAKDIPPHPGGHISFVNLHNMKDNICYFSKSKSKYNKFSRLKILDIIAQIRKINNSLTIGIITPYRQQVIDYNKNIEEQEIIDKKLKIGTIHTFQGSECDIIIFDLVDAPDEKGNKKIGKLYSGLVGERLINVAISRAKSKIIFVGDNRIFHEYQGVNSVSSSVVKIIDNAWNERLKLQK